MEFTEVVSPHVAVPVVGVLLCAFLVFAFGFKTPGQPPSFNFEEDNKRKRSKKSKVILLTSLKHMFFPNFIHTDDLQTLPFEKIKDAVSVFCMCITYSLLMISLLI